MKPRMESPRNRSLAKPRQAISIALAALAVAAMVTLLPAATGDTIADGVLGQPDFVHESPNTVNGAGMSAPDFVAVDQSATPNHLYVVDTANNRVLGWKTAASFADGAAADLVIGQPDFFSSRPNVTNSQPTANTLYNPTGVAVDSNGNLYVADSGNNRVLEYSAPFSACDDTFPCAGQGASTVFGQLGDFAASGCNFEGFTVTPDADSLCGPNGVALDSHDDLYIADTINNRVLEYITPLTASATPGSGDMTADLVFGQGASGIAFTVNTSNNGGLTGTSLSGPRGLAVDGSDDLYISDTNNNRILEFDEAANPPANVAPRLVFGQSNLTTGLCGSSASINGLCQPYQVAVDAGNNLYVADRENNRALEYSTPFVSGMSADLSFHGPASACINGPLTASTLCAPQGVAVDAAGDVFFADTNDNRVLRFNTPLSSDTVGDSVLGQPDFTHHAANSVDASGVWSPTQVAIDRSSTPNHLYLADTNNSRVLGWTNAASFANGAPADLVLGQPDLFSGGANSGGTASAATMGGPMGVAVDSKGNLYVSDSSNNRVLEFNTPFTTCASPPCAANLVLGQAGFTTTTCAAVSATSLCVPRGLTLDGNDNLYVTDSANNRVLEYITPLSGNAAGGGDAIADLVFGQGASGTAFTSSASNNGGVGATSLNGPRGVAADGSGNLYISDTLNNRVLEFNEDANPPLNVTANMVFGQGGVLTTNACKSASAATLCAPTQLAIDSANNLWVADTSESRVLEFDKPLTTDTAADRVFGQADSLEAAQCNFGNTNAPAAATLCSPTGVALDSAGDLLVADNANNRLLRFDQPLVAAPTPSPTPTPGHTPTPTPVSTPTPAFAGTLSVTTPELFGAVGIGAAKTELLAVHNVSPHKTMIVSLGALGAPFAVLSGFGPFEIAPLHKTTVTLQFAPTAIGKAAGTLDIASTDPTLPNHTFKVALSGRGVAGTLTIPASVGFGSIGIGVAPGSTTFAVKNTGIGTLTGSVGALSAPFNVSAGGGPFTLAPGQKQPVTVQFTPAGAGHVGAKFTITSDDAAHPSVNLSIGGTGVAGHLMVNLPAPVPPAVLRTLGFGKVKTNATLTRTFTVTNSAIGVLDGNVGTFPVGSPFSITQGGGPYTLQPHESLMIGVQFAPVATGKTTATLVITNTAPGTPASVKVATSGNGS